MQENTDTMSENVGDNVGEKTVSDGNLKPPILDMVAENNKAYASKIAKTMSVTQRAVERYIKEFREESQLILMF